MTMELTTDLTEQTREMIKYLAKMDFLKCWDGENFYIIEDVTGSEQGLNLIIKEELFALILKKTGCPMMWSTGY